MKNNQSMYIYIYLYIHIHIHRKEGGADYAIRCAKHYVGLQDFQAVQDGRQTEWVMFRIYNIYIIYI